MANCNEGRTHPAPSDVSPTQRDVTLPKSFLFILSLSSLFFLFPLSPGTRLPSTNRKPPETQK
jgi:hypothetical protein